MGTFGGYMGNTNIPETQREKFAEQMMKILNLGGMMRFEEISMYGHEMGLLNPVEIYPGGKVEFYYNYFEDDCWENAGFDAYDAYFWSNKIGAAEFCDVITAAYTLYEVYDNEQGYAVIDGEVVTTSEVVGWLNHILGTNFSMEKRFQFWKNAEELVMERIDKYSEDKEMLSYSELMAFIPYEMRYAAGGVEFTDVLYVINGTESLTEEEVKEGTYPYDVLQCKRALETYFSETKGDAVEQLWEVLKKNRESRKRISDEQMKKIADFSLILPARVIIYLAAEIEKIPFWKTWKELKEEVYQDEQMKLYASEELDLWRRQKRAEAIAPISTSTFLRQDKSFTFWNTPDELKGTPKYYISDADRLYWWDGSEEVSISEEMDEWLKELAKQHKELKETIKEENSSQDFLKAFLYLIKEIDSYYHRIYPFRNMFYEFIQNSGQKDYLAAVELLRKLADAKENRKAGEIIKHVRHGSWDITSKNVTQNIARLRLKRYLSVMANEKLRKKYFGF